MIKQRKRTRQQNPKDPLIAQQNTNIGKEIQNHKQALWKQHITDNWDHKTNTHTLWKTINGLAHEKPPQTPNITITFNNKTAVTDKQKSEHFNKQFTNHIKHTHTQTIQNYRQIHQQTKINTHTYYNRTDFTCHQASKKQQLNRARQHKHQTLQTPGENRTNIPNTNFQSLTQH